MGVLIVANEYEEKVEEEEEYAYVGQVEQQRRKQIRVSLS